MFCIASLVGLVGEVLCIALGFALYYSKFDSSLGKEEGYDAEDLEYRWAPDWGALLGLALLWSYWRQWRLYRNVEEERE